ncbi:hypothetical protein TNCV_1532011 [Trichonephila clavipes]|nr:hypothetical protein TNCV_1532011 [Trichonephila clavipes]
MACTFRQKRNDSMLSSKHPITRSVGGVVSTSHYEETRGLMATDLVILDINQLTPERSPPSPNYHVTRRTLSLDGTAPQRNGDLRSINRFLGGKNFF